MVVPQVTGNALRRRELGACLRAYRQLIRPVDAGLPTVGRRRTPGLRREEVCALSGVGLSWYTWLEQGRVVPSGHVLDAVGRVLRLDAAARQHLRAVAEPGDPAPDVPAASFASLLESWSHSPAVLLDHRLDMVAGNREWAQRWGDPRELAPAQRHVLQLLSDPRTAAHLGDGAALVRALATRFRMATNLHAGDGRISEVRALLRAAAPQLGPVWDCRAVGGFGAPHAELDGRPVVAHLLRAADHPSATVLVLVPGRERG